MLLLTIRYPDVRLGSLGGGDTVLFPSTGPQLLRFLTATLLKLIYEVLSVCSKLVPA